MEYFLTHFIRNLILPPGNIVLLFVICIILAKYGQRIAQKLFLFTLVLLYLFCTPLMGSLLMTSLEKYPALSQDQLIDSKAKAIVVLGGGRERNALEFGGDTVSENTFLRLRYGAFLQSKTNLPILVTGGFIREGDTPEGKLMTNSLQQDYKTTANWQENRSRNTAENALFSKQMLDQEKIDHIFLVTSAWHMPRSVAIFEQVGFHVIPAPTGFEGFKPNHIELNFFDFLPHAKGLEKSYYALHEMLGRTWYYLRY